MRAKRILTGAAVWLYWLIRIAAWITAVTISIGLIIVLLFAKPGGLLWTR